MATTVNFDSFLPEGETLYDYQQVGVAYALVQTADGKGCFIADEQQLGKSRQAIVTAKVRDCQKILVVCKSRLKSNWAREIARCAPEWGVPQVLGGTRPYETIGQVCIISFDLLSTWVESLIADGFDALIVDESHYCKSMGTKSKPVQRTVAGLQISEDVRSRGGLVLLLTGTAYLNRPVELVTQLEMIGRLEEVAPQPRKGTSLTDWEYSFKWTFCGPTQNDSGRWDYKGTSNLDLMNTRLRGTGFVRRLRNEALGMEDTHRNPEMLSLNGGLDPYWEAEEHFVPKHPASAAIELLGKLRMAVGMCKIPAAVEWVEDFIEENPGKKVLVWAWHEEVQKGVAEALNKAGITATYLGGVKNIQDAVDAYNQGDVQVLVCSLQAHREGLPLKGDGHNSTQSLFVEMPWHPGAVSQAEDRQQGIGQEEPVFATTLIVPDTVDQWLADLIAAKWESFKAGINGQISAAEEDDIKKLLLAQLAEHYQKKYGKPLGGQ